ncbi:hypothetical protein GGR50DRAFT_640435, partial [Xylaria sp. CBS 124048]
MTTWPLVMYLCCLEVGHPLIRPYPIGFGLAESSIVTCPLGRTLPASRTGCSKYLDCEKRYILQLLTEPIEIGIGRGRENPDKSTEPCRI